MALLGGKTISFCSLVLSHNSGVHLACLRDHHSTIVAHLSTLNKILATLLIKLNVAIVATYNEPSVAVNALDGVINVLAKRISSTLRSKNLVHIAR